MNKGKLVLLTMGFVLLMTGVLGASGPLVVDFDHYQPGLVGGQDGWTSRYGHGMIQNTVTPDGTGYALEVLLPAELTKAFPELIGARQVEITFKLQLSDRDSKVVFYALDSGRRAVLFFHDEGSRWGLKWRGGSSFPTPCRRAWDRPAAGDRLYEACGFGMPGQWSMDSPVDRIGPTHGGGTFATFVIIRHQSRAILRCTLISCRLRPWEEMKDQVSLLPPAPLQYLSTRRGSPDLSGGAAGLRPGGSARVGNQGFFRIQSAFWHSGSSRGIRNL